VTADCTIQTDNELVENGEEVKNIQHKKLEPLKK
jgi:hypothetical protein